MKIGEQLRRIRYNEVKTSQKLLAEAAGTTAHHLNEIEKGISNPSIGLLEKLVSVMGYEIKIIKK